MFINKGRKPNKANFNALTDLLYSQGYEWRNICQSIGISTHSYTKYFRSPLMFNLNHLIKISYLTQKPLPHIINLCLGFNSKSPHWFNEDSLPVDEKLELIKLKKGKE